MATLAQPQTTCNGTITKSELFRAYNHLRAVIRKLGDQKAMDRLNKAFGILQSKNYYQAERTEYQPTAYDCKCKDWEYRATKRRGTTCPCKHQFAEMLLESILKDRAAHQVTQPVTNLRRSRMQGAAAAPQHAPTTSFYRQPAPVVASNHLNGMNND